jgi:hypothetical protein
MFSHASSAGAFALVVVVASHASSAGAFTLVVVALHASSAGAFTLVVVVALHASAAGAFTLVVVVALHVPPASLVIAFLHVSAVGQGDDPDQEPLAVDFHDRRAALIPHRSGSHAGSAGTWPIAIAAGTLSASLAATSLVVFVFVFVSVAAEPGTLGPLGITVGLGSSPAGEAPAAPLVAFVVVIGPSSAGESEHRRHQQQKC